MSDYTEKSEQSQINNIIMHFKIIKNMSRHNAAD